VTSGLGAVVDGPRADAKVFAITATPDQALNKGEKNQKKPRKKKREKEIKRRNTGQKSQRVPRQSQY